MLLKIKKLHTYAISIKLTLNLVLRPFQEQSLFGRCSKNCYPSSLLRHLVVPSPDGVTQRKTGTQMSKWFRHLCKLKSFKTFPINALWSYCKFNVYIRASTESFIAKHVLILNNFDGVVRSWAETSKIYQCLSSLSCCCGK